MTEDSGYCSPEMKTEDILPRKDEDLKSTLEESDKEIAQGHEKVNITKSFSWRVKIAQLWGSGKNACNWMLTNTK